MAHVAENTHWYDKDGEPIYTVIGKNKKERNTTLRDARVLHLRPSVTTIIKEANAPALVNWKIDQHILSCLTLEREPNESEKEYIDRIKLDATEQARQAAEKGTKIHAWVQSGFENQQLPEEGMSFWFKAEEEIIEYCGIQTWCCEKSFATARFGGKADLHTQDYLIDIKTTEKPKDDLAIWDTHLMQLAAYQVGLNLNPSSKCGILYINTRTAEANLLLATQEQIERGWNMFTALLDYWYAKTGLKLEE